MAETMMSDPLTCALMRSNMRTAYRKYPIGYAGLT